MEIWGITGIIGSGKSSAIKYLKDQGFPCIDADEVSRIVVDKNRPEGQVGFEKIYRAFGAEVLDNLGNLDRGKLRRRMMLRPNDRDTLEQILHPLIIEYIKKQLTEWKSKDLSDIVFIEGSRLVESGMHRSFTGLVVVTAPEAQILKRVMARDTMGKDEVKMMLSLQDPRGMESVATKVWKNAGPLSELHSQIEAFLDERLGSSS
ncbi:MAG TPA: dephospho-CoA kinase [Bdellovibrionota bacterium]|jgi:dephospho-CoA kinase|nr:dephospho-CoA kinase [Bdellovibrionota bacterium]